MTKSLRTRAPSVRQLNEYFENESLSWELEGMPPQERFMHEVRKYAGETDQVRQVRQIEAVIRTSRGLEDNHRPLPRDIQETISAIMKRYEIFSPTKMAGPPKTFAEARQLLRTLFF